MAGTGWARSLRVGRGVQGRVGMLVKSHKPNFSPMVTNCVPYFMGMQSEIPASDCRNTYSSN